MPVGYREGDAPFKEGSCRRLPGTAGKGCPRTADQDAGRVWAAIQRNHQLGRREAAREVCDLPLWSTYSGHHASPVTVSETCVTTRAFLQGISQSANAEKQAASVVFVAAFKSGSSAA